MSTLGKKNGIYHVRFRYGSKSYKKSLKTHSDGDAQMALHDVERALIGLERRILVIPPNVDPAEFILCGGRIAPAPPQPALSIPSSDRQQTQPAAAELPSLHNLIEDYLAVQVQKAPSTRATERVHLRNLESWLGVRKEFGCDQISAADLEAYLVARSQQCEEATVEKERSTIVQLFRWAVAKRNLSASPATDLPEFKSEADSPRFKTTAEIARILERGGLDEEELLDVWDCLYLNPGEIAGLLQTVQKNSLEDLAPLLHFIPAYTGMRRGEVLRLRWADVDFETDGITAWSRKQSRSNKDTKRTIDLHPELKTILLRWQAQRPKGQFVVSEIGTLTPLIPSRANAAFLQPLRNTFWCLDRKRRRYKIGFHTYRHSFASNLAARGIDQRLIDEFMGHQTDAMRKRYRHLFPKDRKKAIGSFSYRISSVPPNAGDVS